MQLRLSFRGPQKGKSWLTVLQFSRWDGWIHSRGGRKGSSEGWCPHPGKGPLVVLKTKKTRSGSWPETGQAPQTGSSGCSSFQNLLQGSDLLQWWLSGRPCRCYYNRRDDSGFRRNAHVLVTYFLLKTILIGLLGQKALACSSTNLLIKRGAKEEFFRSWMEMWVVHGLGCSLIHSNCS